MKILVPIKRVPDPDQKILIREDGRGIDLKNTSFVMNPFDAIALEKAVQIGETSDADPVEIVAVGICSVEAAEEESELREALAMGADRALLVVVEAKPDPWNVARLLQALVEREKPDLVLMGKQAIDDDSNQTGQFLAALLGWSQATFASSIESVDGGFRVGREIDAGIEHLQVGLPAIITTDLRLCEPRYASLPSLIKAKKKPLERIEGQELGVEIEPRIELLQLSTTSTERSCTQVDSPEELVEKLRSEAKVI